MKGNRETKDIRDFIDNPVEQKLTRDFYNSMSDTERQQLNDEFADILSLEIDRERFRAEEGLGGDAVISDESVRVWRQMKEAIVTDCVSAMVATRVEEQITKP